MTLDELIRRALAQEAARRRFPVERGDMADLDLPLQSRQKGGVPNE